MNARHLVRRAISQIVVAPADVVIEAARNGFGDRDEILVAAVARACEHDDAPAHDVEAQREIRQHADGMRIVSVVEQHLERVLVENVHAPGRLEERRVERPQPLADRIQL